MLVEAPPAIGRRGWSARSGWSAQEVPMHNPVLPLAVAAVVILIVLTELLAAALPLLIIITLVPEHERQQLAGLLAACDSSRKLRLWTALDVAVKARRLRQRA
jgi:hypothetical protein